VEALESNKKRTLLLLTFEKQEAVDKLKAANLKVKETTGRLQMHKVKINELKADIVRHEEDHETLVSRSNDHEEKAERWMQRAKTAEEALAKSMRESETDLASLEAKLTSDFKESRSEMMIKNAENALHAKEEASVETKEVDCKYDTLL